MYPLAKVRMTRCYVVSHKHRKKFDSQDLSFGLAFHTAGGQRIARSVYLRYENQVCKCIDDSVV